MLYDHEGRRRATSGATTALSCLALMFAAGAGSSSGGAGSPAAGAGRSGGAGRTACEVLTPAIARKVLGSGSHLTRKAKPNPHETQCQYQNGRGGAVNVMVGDWSFVHPFS